MFETFEVNFQNLLIDKKQPCSELIVSVSTLATRFTSFLKKVLPSIENMHSIDKIYVHVQTNVMRLNVNENVFDQYKNLNNTKIHFFYHQAEDLGPISKLSRTLELVEDGNACIVTLDDDTVYADVDRVSVLKSYAENFPDAAIGFACQEIPSILKVWQYVCPTCLFWHSKNYGSLAGLITFQTCQGWLLGWEGVIYRRRFFPLIFEASNTCYFTDDVMISGYLHKNQIQRLVYTGLESPLHLPKNESDALSLISKVQLEWQWPCAKDMFW
jgi:hypothetical protein